VPAGWRCEQCRRQGLEATRRCGFLAEERRGPRRIVWGKGGVSLDECPTSAISPQSVEWLEKYLAWKLAGGGDVLKVDSRVAEAYLTLEKEWRESQDGIQSPGQSGNRI